jgi:hypothetical protein
MLIVDGKMLEAHFLEVEVKRNRVELYFLGSAIRRWPTVCVESILP